MTWLFLNFLVKVHHANFLSFFTRAFKHKNNDKKQCINSEGRRCLEVTREHEAQAARVQIPSNLTLFSQTLIKYDEMEIAGSVA